MTILSSSAGLHVGTVAVEDVSTLLGKMPVGHRVLWGEGGEAQLRAMTKTDPLMARELDVCVASAEAILNLAPIERKLIGSRLLDKSRTALSRTIRLGIAYRMTRDQRFAERAKREMLAIARFEDWGPFHFLDVGEMTAAMAIGLDWCRDALSDGEKQIIIESIVQKGIGPSFEVNERLWWLRTTNNWNPVCHGGLVLGAIAVAHVNRELAARVIASAVECLPLAMSHYAPDGAYPEGASYWGYGTSFNIMALHALRVALGTDFDLSKQPGFLLTGRYYLHMNGPTGQFFTYSDSWQRKEVEPNPSMFYFAAETGDPSMLFFERQWIEQEMGKPIDGEKVSRGERTRPLLLVWAKPSQDAPAPASTHYVGQGVTPVAAHRTSWTRDATYVAIKAGTASASHGHMDAGAFTLQSLGQTWADDLGAQPYESLESKNVNLWDMSQDGERWQIFRIGPMSHNVLTVDGQLHDMKGVALIKKSIEDRTVIDLTPLYFGRLKSASRGVRLEANGAVTLRDEVTAGDAPATVRFAMLTRAGVALHGQTVTLTLGRKMLAMHLTGIEPADFKITDATGRQPYDAPNPGATLITFHVPLAAKQSAGWTVYFLPNGDAPSRATESLDQW